MEKYLEKFLKRLEKWKGSLVRVKSIEHSHSKEYLNKLAKRGIVERIKWGWYWIPDDVKDIWEFLEKDRNFKVISSQSAASFWNHDFIHRDIVVIKVNNKSYGEAVKEFCRRRGWEIEVEYVKDISRIGYVKVGNLKIEKIDECIIDCFKHWAFMDAFATLYVNRNKVNIRRLFQDNYWKRIPHSQIRIGQVLKYGFSLFNEKGRRSIFPIFGKEVADKFLKEEIEEAVEKVAEIG
ncbi:hypothetical protein J7K43_08125 [Candidatus Calescamantes bacterium]|nr:hypothetical protein [Candidatus Calescamantes bacterium]